MLFTAKAGKTFAGPPIGAASCIAAASDKNWPLDPIEIVDGVPFLVAKTVTISQGFGGTPTRYVEYCLKNCDWNPYQFKPKTAEEKRKALEKLLATPSIRKESGRRPKVFLASQIDRPDILLADFEGDAYPDGWKTTGTAFGKGPAKGTLPNQMPVTGYPRQGARQQLPRRRRQHRHAHLARVQDRAEVPQLPHRRRQAPGKTCINLLVDGKVVRTATGPNDKPGGSERLDWHTWDVGEFEGKKAVIEIVDDEKGGWGHINVDHIVQSDAKKQAEPLQPRVHDRQAVPAPAGEERRAEAAHAASVVATRPSASSTSNWPTASRTSGSSPTCPRSRARS